MREEEEKRKEGEERETTGGREVGTTSDETNLVVEVIDGGPLDLLSNVLLLLGLESELDEDLLDCERER